MELLRTLLVYFDHNMHFGAAILVNGRVKRIVHLQYNEAARINNCGDA